MKKKTYGNRNVETNGFFHAPVKGNRSRNGLKMLLDSEGNLQRSEASMGEVASKYFDNLFTSASPSNPQNLLANFEQRVSVLVNECLISKVTKEEVKAAVFAVKSSSAPGADGMTCLFFQQYWEVVGHQVTSEVLAFFESGSFPKEWNFTQICLIPKKGNSPLMSDLRPINLCSVLYKVILRY